MLLLKHLHLIKSMITSSLYLHVRVGFSYIEHVALFLHLMVHLASRHVATRNIASSFRCLILVTAVLTHLVMLIAMKHVILFIELIIIFSLSFHWSAFMMLYFTPSIIIVIIILMWMCMIISNVVLNKSIKIINEMNVFKFNLP